MGRVVLLGATGYTGRLIAASLAKRSVPALLAGRDPARLAQVAADCGGLDTATADIGAPGSLRALLGRGDVLISTVGPFSTSGGPAVEAAIDAGAHYLDTSGAGQWIRQVFERYGPRAADAGCALVPSVGFESAPGHLAAELALKHAGAPVDVVEVSYLAPGVNHSSRGTRASVVQDLLEPGFAYRDGVLVEERVARSVHRPPGLDRRWTGISIPSSEHLVLPGSHPQLREVRVLLAGLGGLARPAQILTWVTDRLRRSATTHRALERVLAALVGSASDGPGDQARSGASCSVLARAVGPRDTTLSTVELTGPDPYDLTADLISWAAEQAAGSGLMGTGALGAVEAFGVERLRDGMQEAGMCVTVR